MGGGAPAGPPHGELRDGGGGGKAEEVGGVEIAVTVAGVGARAGVGVGVGAEVLSVVVVVVATASVDGGAWYMLSSRNWRWERRAKVVAVSSVTAPKGL